MPHTHLILPLPLSSCLPLPLLSPSLVISSGLAWFPRLPMVNGNIGNRNPLGWQEACTKQFACLAQYQGPIDPAPTPDDPMHEQGISYKELRRQCATCQPQPAWDLPHFYQALCDGSDAKHDFDTKRRRGTQLVPVKIMSEYKIHLILTSEFSTIAGTLLSAYISLGVPAKNLITASMMSIPASIAISRIHMLETEEPVTWKNSNGALSGLIIAGQVLCNVVTILSVVATINGLLTWIGRGFSIHALTLQLVLRYIFYHATFFIGVPCAEILHVSELLVTKLVKNELVAYTSLQALMASGEALSPCGFTIASYVLCGFVNFGSLGIQIGVLSALALSHGHIVARIGPGTIICGFLSMLQATGIACIYLSVFVSLWFTPNIAAMLHWCGPQQPADS
ncbi:Na+ dependent nucleoside transporter C-terminus-domain-containing protein [Lactarius quietus]|nr:Na+ dependent nucleoside transporter C-terminus-domain-containing protein [Lactarius quietus]